MNNSLRNFLASTFVIAVFSLGTGNAHQFGQGTLDLDQIYPGPLSFANFGKIISGEFTGDLKRDVVVMNNSEPLLCVAPETYQTGIRVRAQANDICTQSNLFTYQDVILTVSSAGLVRYRRDSDNAQWVETILRGSGTNWINATRVAVGEINGTPPEDIVGIGANGRDVLIEYGNSDGSYTPGTTFQSYSQGVLDLQLLNWRESGDTAGTDEIALISMQGLEVFEYNGVFLDGINYTAAQMPAAVIDDAGAPVQRLALVMQNLGNDKLYVYGDTQSDTWATLGAAGSVVSLAAADADADGYSDLFVNFKTEKNFKKLINRSPLVPSFQVSTAVSYAYGPVGRHAADEHAGLATGDFNSDGKIDVIAPAQGDLTAPYDALGMLELVNVEVDNVDEWRVDISSVYYKESTNQLKFYITRPDSVFQNPPTGQVDEIGIKVFYTAALGEGTSANPIREAFVAIPATSGTTLYAMDLDPDYPDFSLSDSNYVFTLVMRMTRRNPTTHVVYDIAPATTAIFTPGVSVDVVSQGPKVTNFAATTKEDESVPGDGGVNVGPPVPSLDEEEEPRDRDPRS